MLTLDEAIAHCEEKAREIRKANEEMPTDCKLSEDLCECAKEHEQLEEWLKELKALKECKGDLISREALKEQINDVVAKDGDDFSNDLLVGLDMAFQIIDNAPTVEIDERTVKDAYDQGYTDGWKERYGEPDGRPKGEWIEKVERRGCFAGDKTVYSYTCPFCGVKEFKKYPFCHCGADMRKGGAE